MTQAELQERLDDEARRIGHVLHDEASQLLASVHIALEDVASGLPPGDASRIRGIRGLLDRIEEQLRSLSHEVHPVLLQEEGLQAAVRYLAGSVSARWGVPVTVHSLITGDVPPSVEGGLYRVIQEAVNNAIRHGRPTRVLVTLLRAGDAVQARIADDGSGFRALKPVPGREDGIGLSSMRERVDALGGDLFIRSYPGCGTQILVEIPLGD